MEFIGMLVSALTSDYHWTDRSVHLPDLTLAFLSESAVTGFPDVLWVDRVSRGYLSLKDVVTSGSAVQYAELRRMYVSPDMCDK